MFHLSLVSSQYLIVSELSVLLPKVSPEKLWAVTATAVANWDN